MELADFKALLDAQGETIRKGVQDDIVSAINAISEKFDNKFKEMHEAIMREVDRKFNEFKSSSSAAAFTAPSEAGGYSNKRGRLEVDEVQQGAPVGGRGRPSPSQIWLLGFPRELLKANLEKFTSKLIEARMPSWVGRLSVKAYNLKTKCSAIFEES